MKDTILLKAANRDEADPTEEYVGFDWFRNMFLHGFDFNVKTYTTFDMYDVKGDE